MHTQSQKKVVSADRYRHSSSLTYIQVLMFDELKTVTSYSLKVSVVYRQKHQVQWQLPKIV